MINTSHLFWHIFLVIRIGLLGLFKNIASDTSLPVEFDGFELQKIIKTFPCGIGVYKNNLGQQILLKTWRGPVRTYEYYQLEKEVHLYELLQRVLERLGPRLADKYKRVRIPRLLAKKISPTHIVAVFEFMRDCVNLRDVQSFTEKSQTYEMAVDFWEYIGNQLTEGEREELPRRNLAVTLFTYAVVLVYAMCRYPQRLPDLMRTIPIVLHALPALATTWREELIHRDFHFENVLVNKNHISIIDFGDNALTHPLFVFAYALHWEWDFAESRDVILKSLGAMHGRTPATDQILRALFAISAVQMLHDTGSKDRLKLNFRCFDAVVHDWRELSAVLLGSGVFGQSTSADLMVK